MKGGFGLDGTYLGHSNGRCSYTYFKSRKMHGSEGRSAMRTDLRVVITDDADVLRAPQASLFDGTQRPEGHHVIVREDGGRQLLAGPKYRDRSEVPSLYGCRLRPRGSSDERAPIADRKPVEGEPPVNETRDKGRTLELANAPVP